MSDVEHVRRVGFHLFAPVACAFVLSIESRADAQSSPSQSIQSDDSQVSDSAPTSDESAIPIDSSDSRNLPTATVGMPGTIDGIVLPGSELEVKRREDRDAPIVLRIVATYPHGTAHRYDMIYYGLEPGRHDLKEYLRRADGSTIDDVPALPVEVVSVLPAGQIQPNMLRAERAPRLGGYRTALFVLGGVWIVGLLAIVLTRRSKRRREALAARRPVTLAERLRPLVEAAREGRLDEHQKGELERMLLAYWRRRLNLYDLKPADAVAQLREHEQAGPLIRQLESWLHAPGRADSVDIGELLEPYQDISLDEADRELESTSTSD